MHNNSREKLREIYQREDNSQKTFIPAKPKVDPNERNRFFRVCAYCRVSTDSDEQLSSYELQQAHYLHLVEDHPNWELRHIYADEGISGTSLKKRDQFVEMIEACKHGEYDLIVTKSVSRFARNLVDCISIIRLLKGLPKPVGVYFETDNLNTLGENNEFMLSFLATFAQEESVKKSEAMNWSLMQRFKDGKLLTPALLGYDRPKDVTGRYIKYAPLKINESEAAIVRFIYDAYLFGWTQEEIANFLTDIGCETKTGVTEWSVFYDGSQEPVHSLYSMEALKTRDKYRVFLDGNHGLTRIVNPQADSGGKLLIIKDSYAHCFAPFAALHFPETLMIDLRYYNGRLGDLIQEQEITDVLVLYQIPGFLKDRNISKLVWG